MACSFVQPPPCPCPRSPPVCPDFSGRRREIVNIQLLEREITLLQGELRLLQGPQLPASACCKELVELVDANSDPFLPIKKKTNKKRSIWKWICKSPCLIFSWIGGGFCCYPCAKIPSSCWCCPIPSCAISDFLPSRSACSGFFVCPKCGIPTPLISSNMFKCSCKCQCPCNCRCASVFACCRSIMCCSFFKCHCNSIKFNSLCCWCLSL